MLLYGTLYWLILAPKNNFSSLPVSILGTNLSFSLSSLLLGLCHGNHKCEQRSLIQLGSASVATIMAAFGVIKNAHAGGALASRVV